MGDGARGWWDKFDGLNQFYAGKDLRKLIKKQALIKNDLNSAYIKKGYVYQTSEQTNFC